MENAVLEGQQRVPDMFISYYERGAAWRKATRVTLMVVCRPGKLPRVNLFGTRKQVPGTHIATGHLPTIPKSASYH